ncbi:hypothetical protein UFOVP124_65 [uncultured Caudovirales phage]|uniref:Uncharacterized protein n=1 Tax=uncultured Caudovirales phage TaxID=2100421 RepID=A0A6J5LDF9_9CAUD|nr:hypothetical protein UFOVP124_65 [uncultured Caudovirales phage]
MRRLLSFDHLESIESLSSLGHKPLHRHKPPHHVHASVAKPPHQVQLGHHTGTLISGAVEVADITSGLNGIAAGTMVLAGSGSVNIARHAYGAGVSISTNDQVGSLCIGVGNDLIFADVVTLADGSAGNYRITQATGQFAGISGTGIFQVTQTDSGYSIAFNPHQ